jgi:hypothetical protein
MDIRDQTPHSVYNLGALRCTLRATHCEEVKAAVTTIYPCDLRLCG